jgi:hypothetical protein
MGIVDCSGGFTASKPAVTVTDALSSSSSSSDVRLGLDRPREKPLAIACTEPLDPVISVALDRRFGSPASPSVTTRWSPRDNQRDSSDCTDRKAPQQRQRAVAVVTAPH